MHQHFSTKSVEKYKENIRPLNGLFSYVVFLGATYALTEGYSTWLLVKIVRQQQQIACCSFTNKMHAILRNASVNVTLTHKASNGARSYSISVRCYLDWRPAGRLLFFVCHTKTFFI